MDPQIIHALLAWTHHLCAFALLAVLLAEWCLTAQDLDATGLRHLGRLDLAYGALAGAMVVAGVARLIWGGKGWAFYSGNPLFWTKLVLFGVMGLLSVVPTLRILRWRRLARPLKAAEMQSSRRWMTAQLLLAPPLILMAALMARGIGH
jgi:putative membrane protein